MMLTMMTMITTTKKHMRMNIIKLLMRLKMILCTETRMRRRRLSGKDKDEKEERDGAFKDV